MNAINPPTGSPETQMLHAPYPLKDAYGALSMPVYQAVAYEFETAAQMEAAFTGKSPEHVYSRVSNPTVQYFEQRVKTLTGADEVIAFNSGMAAIANTFIAVAQAGANIVTSPHLFGNTYSLIAFTLNDFGVEPRFCNLSDVAEVEKQLDRNTCAVFLETITNPQMEVADLQALSEICKKHRVPLIADTTIVPFTAFKAAAFGVDVEVVSSTKYISGGATSLGGLVLDYGSYDWRQSSKLRTLAGQDGLSAFSLKIRREIHRNLGACMTPEVAAKQLTGLETVAIRYERAAATCRALAAKVRPLDGVASVNYPALEGHPFRDVSRRQFGEYPGAMFTFDVVSREAAFRFIDRLKLIRRATNLFDHKTLAIHPASTIFGTFSEALRQRMDVSQNTIRISVGLEHIDDLYGDFAQALLRD
ncbi:MAG: aminotransferase class I/II-fold pyridoxal phosphate-dependent enzyme [Prevotellaceae bacterium]|nr:aminotransferase class I/II-fold pyridoxal phosphate-dependent enzyme [Prevotellaceae bacterium]